MSTALYSAPMSPPEADRQAPQLPRAGAAAPGAICAARATCTAGDEGSKALPRPAASGFISPTSTRRVTSSGAQAGLPQVSRPVVITRSEPPFGQALDVAPTTSNAPQPAAGRDSASVPWRVTPDGGPYVTDLLRLRRTTVVLHVRQLSDKIPSAPPPGWAYYTSPGVTCLTSAAGQVQTLNIMRAGELRRFTEV